MLSSGVKKFPDPFLHDGRVIDFMNFGIGSFWTGIFNVADVCIITGLVLLVFHTFQPPRSSVEG